MRINKAGLGFIYLCCMAFFFLGFALACLAQLSKSSIGTMQIAARPVIDAYFLPSGDGWIVASDGHREFLFTTRDQGDHWSKTLLNFPIATISFLNDKHGLGVAIAEKDLSLVETWDGGQAWRHLCVIPKFSSDTTVLSSLVPSHSGTAWILGSGPGGLDTVLFINTRTCAVRRPFSRSNTYGLARAMFGDKESGELWVVGNDSIFYSRDFGESWKPQVNRSTLREATSFNAGVALGNGTAFAVGGSVEGTVYRTVDHGLHWDLIAKPAKSHWLDNIYFWDLGHGCAVGGSTTMACTSDGGSTWETRKTLPRLGEGAAATDIVYTKIAFVNGGKRGWVMANGGFIFQTDDNANSWHALDLLSMPEP